MTFSAVIVGLVLLGLGWFGVLRTDGFGFVGGCTSCGIGVALLSWGLTP